MIGKTLGNYRIVEQIGTGGMATVYKAYDPDTERHVALKVLPKRYSEDPTFRQRFEREARAIAQLEHLHILPVHAYGEEDGIAYLVMRHMEAGTLADLIERGPLPLDEARRLLEQIASALDAAHEGGIVHRDVKPSNVLLDAQGNAYLTDFGIAKMVEGVAEQLTETGMALGTPAYMSTEQCRGAKDLTPASDIYSLGVVLYQMLTGAVPFDAETPLAVIQQHLNEPLPPPRQVRRDLPDEAEAVIFKAMAKEPEQRYRSAGEMAAAFASALKRPVLAGRVVPKGLRTIPVKRLAEEKAEAQRDRKRTLLIGGGAALALLVGVVAVLLASGNLNLSGAISQPVDEFDGAETSGGGAIEVGSNVVASLGSFDEAHNWTFEGAEGDVVLIYVAGDGESDPRATLIGPDGTIAAENDDGGEDRDAFINMALPADGTYTIRVRSFVAGSYTLSLDTTIVPALPGEFDGGDGLETTGGGTIEVGTSVTNRLQTLLEAHNWTFEGKSGQVVSIYVDSDGTSDPRARLIDPDGEVIAEDDDGGDVLDAAIDTTLPFDGTYTIRVDTHVSGGYTLTLE